MDLVLVILEEMGRELDQWMTPPFSPTLGCPLTGVNSRQNRRASLTIVGGYDHSYFCPYTS